ncbi:MAG: sigma-70 family RNA polymerase sigma factor [Saprospiraceae bacterium]|nr:sigma-70 family RNA polymerase sigma factor [Candidatus Defluviibacterium haderslevense]
MAKLSDKDLLILLKEQNNNAFAQLYLYHTVFVHKLVLANSGDAEDAKDVEQSVIIHLYEKLIQGKFELNEGVKLSSYLFAVAKNIWLKKLDLKGKLPTENFDKFVDKGQIDVDIENLFIPEGPKETTIIDCLELLNNDCQSILTKYYYEEKAMREIALEIATITEENLRKRKYKCIQKLKELYNQKIMVYG